MLFNLVLLRKLEYHERLDFALKRRLKAENIHVNLEMEAFNLFSTAVASAAASSNMDSNGMSLESGTASTLAAFRVRDQDLRLRDQVGAGALCDVFLGKWRATEVAVKKLRGSEGAGADGEVQEAIRAFGGELAVLSQLRHPNICMLLGMCYYPPQLVLEYCSRGSLHRLLHLAPPTATTLDGEGGGADGPAPGSDLDMSLRLKLLCEAALGMAYLHQQGVVHRDLKSPNLLVTAEWQCRVADFGLSALKQQRARRALPRDGRDERLLLSLQKLQHALGGAERARGVRRARTIFGNRRHEALRRG